MAQRRSQPVHSTRSDSASMSLQSRWEKFLKTARKTQLARSVLRVKHDDTPRARSLGVLSNVFLHLHPAKINRDAVAYNYRWGMGGMTFFVYIVLVFTGALLMFYYHPSKVVAFRDILYLENRSEERR